MSERDELLTNTDDDDIDESSPCNYGEEPVSSAAPSSPYCADQQQSQQNNIMVRQEAREVEAPVNREAARYMEVSSDNKFWICAGILCFIPLGLVAHHFADKAKKYEMDRDFEKAYVNVYISRILSAISVGIGIMFVVGIILGIVLPLTIHK
jgi:hypothetical protein